MNIESGPFDCVPSETKAARRRKRGQGQVIALGLKAGSDTF